MIDFALYKTLIEAVLVLRTVLPNLQNGGILNELDLKYGGFTAG